MVAHAQLAQELERCAEMANDQPIALDPDRLEASAGQVQDLRVRRRARAADQLDAHLGELARTATRRPLIAKAGPGIVQPQRQAVALQVIHERTHDARGQFGPQAQPSVPMRKGIHARDDLVARFAQEQLERLENRRLDALIAELLEGMAQPGFESAKAGIVRRQDVVGAADALYRCCRAVAEHVHVMCKCTSAYTVPGVGFRRRTCSPLKLRLSDC